MSVRNLDRMFAPRSLAVIGASGKERSIGALVARNAIAGGFKGPIRLVNPKHAELYGQPVFPSVDALPEAPDLAVIATPPPTVPGLIADLGARGCRAAVVITAGFGEAEKKEKAPLRQRMLEAARPHLLRIVGPNCIGFISPHRGINASFAHLSPPAGDPTQQKRLFDWNGQPRTSATTINLSEHGVRLKKGYYYSVEIDALDGIGRKLSNSPSTWRHPDFQAVD